MLGSVGVVMLLERIVPWFCGAVGVIVLMGMIQRTKYHLID
jgi:hypothetical protein